MIDLADMTQNKLTTKEVGNLGEQIAAQYLTNHGYQILAKNYQKKYGEIDLIGEKAAQVHFVEVKTVSYETKRALEWAVSHETWQPEEQVHQFKLHQIHKVLEVWLAEHNYQGNWQIDVAAMQLVPREKLAVVKHIENII